MSRTALHWAAILCLHEITRELLIAGAEVDMKDENGATALHLAANSGCYEVVEMLMAQSADVTSQDNFGRSALHLAAWNGWEDIVRSFLKASAGIESLQDKDGATALHLAVERRCTGVVKLLKDVGASVVVRDKLGWTPMDLAQKLWEKDELALLKVGRGNP